MKMISGLFTFFAFLLAVTGITNGEECSTDRLKRCRYVVSEELQRRSNGLSHQELQFHCKAIRQNLDCIVYQVTMCNSYDDRDSNSDIIWRSWKYLQSVCDTFGGWWQSRCFQRDDVKQCERLFTIEGNSLSRASCTNYLRFRDCVIDVVKRRCDPEESQVLSSYLLDKAQEMVWRCPGTSQISLSFDSAARLSESSSLTGFLNVEGQRYDQCSELRRCEQEVDKFINLSNRLASYECRELIKNLNCLIKSINCMREEERQNLGTKIQRARSQHKTSCNSEEWDKRTSCYDGNEIRRCEEEFPRRLIHSNRENCMKYERFESCVSTAMRSCRGDDNDYAQVYLLDIARDLPWQCPQYSSSYSPSPTSSWPPSGRGTFNEDICCRNERCNRNRLYQCREDLQKVVDSRDSYNQDQRNLCWSYLNKFNCFLWHNYQCADKYDKDSNLLSSAKDSIERRCDAKGDIQRSQCFSSIEVRDCERRLDESSRHGEPSCRDFKMFYDCIERNMRRCNRDDELLFGFYLINKVHHKAWTCSYNDNDSQFTGGSDSSQTYPEDETCESLVRQNYRHCDEKLQKNEEEARNTPGTRDRHVKSCCSALTFRECVRQVVKQQCRRENSMVVESLMGSSLRYRIPTCDDVNYSTCSGTRILCNMLFMIATLITSRIYFKW